MTITYVHVYNTLLRPAKVVNCSGLARPGFLKVEIYLYFYRKKVINKSISVIFGLVRLIY